MRNVESIHIAFKDILEGKEKTLNNKVYHCTYDLAQSTIEDLEYKHSMEIKRIYDGFNLQINELRSELVLLKPKKKSFKEKLIDLFKI